MTKDHEFTDPLITLIVPYRDIALFYFVFLSSTIQFAGKIVNLGSILTPFDQFTLQE
jgi:hypothetical protein